MTNLPSLGIKRAFEDIIVNELKLNYVQDAFTTGVKKDVQVMITDFSTEYTRPRLNSPALAAEMSLPINIFSENNETAVHNAVFDLIKVAPTHPKLIEFRIDEIYPTSSFTNYNNESSNGHVQAQVTLLIKYIIRL
ncbi:hypothetical protein [Klebsiella quasipneumoniae]|uniref:hypothetical protein n=1 Tax=Klebsiella quasipneumoniae TaxID=1463165 RepID=UPI0027E1B37A|nr:hypothetical protein [Klebsiella quasipneumoniae]MDQ6443022.1 hypothetical protein [Klebsiella quasipneumoniae]